MFNYEIKITQVCNDFNSPFAWFHWPQQNDEDWDRGRERKAYLCFHLSRFIIAAQFHEEIL